MKEIDDMSLQELKILAIQQQQDLHGFVTISRKLVELLGLDELPKDVDQFYIIKKVMKKIPKLAYGSGDEFKDFPIQEVSRLLEKYKDYGRTTS